MTASMGAFLATRPFRVIRTIFREALATYGRWSHVRHQSSIGTRPIQTGELDVVPTKPSSEKAPPQPGGVAAARPPSNAVTNAWAKATP